MKSKAFLAVILALVVALFLFVSKPSQNYTLLLEAKGDLNLDGLEDRIMVYKTELEEQKSSTEHPLKRKMILELGQPDKNFKTVAKSMNAVFYYNYDPNFKENLTGIKISKGQFKIEHYGGFGTRWGRSDTFSYSPDQKNWFLTEISLNTFNAIDPSQGTDKTYTAKDFGKISFSKFNIYKMAAEHLF